MGNVAIIETFNAITTTHATPTSTAKLQKEPVVEMEGALPNPLVVE
jgi:hypothetical protein